MEDYHEAEKQAIEQRVSDLNRHFQAQLETKEEELQELQALYAEQVQQMTRHSKQKKGQKAERSKDIFPHKSLKKVKDNVDRTRMDREYTTQAVGGVMNGIATGAAAGVMGTALCIAM